MDWDPITHYQEVAIAERYDRVRFSSPAGRIFNALERACMRRVFKATPRSAIIMDLPCGTGRFAEVLLEEGFKVVGVDISAAMLTVARRKLQRFGECFETRVADVRQLAKCESKSYDIALCARVLMHFPLDEQILFLRSVAALVKTQVVFTQSLSTPYQRFRRHIKRLIGNQAPAKYPITEAELKTLLAAAGLKEVGRMRPMALLSEAIYIIAAPRR